MSRRAPIRLLPDILINQIAAGEVVERPASVVKELLENALDAEADRIRIDIEEGGRRLIRVSDNGAGILPDDLPLAVQRHATSKLATAEDLAAIRTLGFRGEALPSIAAVSHLKIRSTATGAPEGRELAVSGGAEPVVRAAAPGGGTTVEVADLFYNTPARAKFLKSGQTEWGHIAETVMEVALAHPAVQFTLTHNGKSTRQLPAAQSIAERIRQIYPDDLTGHLIDIASGATAPPGGPAIQGMVGRPGVYRSGREHQKFIINGRVIRHAGLAHAVYAAYETMLPAGRHPVFFISITMNPADLDANVHPAKREVRLAAPHALYERVKTAVRDTLGNYRGNALRLTRTPSPIGATAPATPGSADDVAWHERVRQAAAQAIREPAPELPFFPSPSHPATEAAPAPRPMGRIVGQAYQTFVIVEAGNQLRIIDQHTAHERVLYERLMPRFVREGLPAQRLLIPQNLELPQKQAALLVSHQDTLGRLGLELEAFGDGAILVRTLPAPLAEGDLAALITDLVDDLLNGADESSGEKAPLAAAMHPIVATLACHAAVKAGAPLTREEMERLVADLEAVGNPHTCPHGRAVTAVLDRGAIKNLFDRTWGK